jgi:hexosaminidase
MSMKTALCLLIIALHTFALAQRAAVVPVIPKPAVFHRSGPGFRITPKTLITVPAGEFRNEADLLNEWLQHHYGFALEFAEDGDGSSGIVLAPSNGRIGDNEGYSLSVTKDRIRLIGAKMGMLYGIETLIQLLPPERRPSIDVPGVEIQDAPRYRWRGMHLDVARHFFPKEFVKRYIDELVLYKMNTFHFHLTDDQGWRIEIHAYPKLTQVGAWRSGSMIGPYADQRYDSIRYGGFYTQDDIREIVAYALKRHVTIVPEIEMPGHAMAALAAYPELSCTGGPFEVAKGWGVFDDVFCPSEETFTFLEGVLSEISVLFPGKYVHVGGDECPKTRWKACPHCQALIKGEGLKDEAGLQSYFIRRIERFLNARGKQLIGWDEILEGGLAPNATVMSWRGTDGGIAAAKQGHRVIMTPGSHCYFDYYQGDPRYEPLAIGGYTPLEKVYSYEPTPPELTTEEQKFILGAQGNLWTEYITTPQQVEYMAIPRMAALAEVLWSPKQQRSYPDFQQRLMAHFALLDSLGVNYARSIYEVHAVAKPSPSGEGVLFELSTPLDSTGIRYTLDGSVPSSSSMPYLSPIRITRTMTVRVAYFDRGRQLGNGFSQAFLLSKSTGKPISLKTPAHANYPGDGAFTLVNGIRGDLSRYGQNWLGFWGPDLDAVVDLGEAKLVSKVTIDVFIGEGSWIHRPKSVEIFAGNDTLALASVKKLSAAEIVAAGNVLVAPFPPQLARYIRVVATNAGKIPEGKPGAGSDAWLFVDEIIVE